MLTFGRRGVSVGANGHKVDECRRCVQNETLGPPCSWDSDGSR
jgi:hypothetical protein